MATFTSSKIANRSPRFLHEGLVTESAEYTASAAWSGGDVVQMVHIPEGAKVLDLVVSGNRWVDGSADAVYSVGDGGDVDRFVSDKSASSVTVQRLDNVAGHNYTYTTDDTIDVRVSAEGSGPTSAPIVRLSVTYALDQ